MKKHYIFIIVVALIVFSGCKKFLDKKPNDTIDPSAFYQKPADFELAIKSVYNTLQLIYAAAPHYGYGWNGEESFGDRSTWTNNFPSTYNLNASNSNYSGVWSVFYTGIKEANSILKALENKPDAISDSIANNYKGEALFLRGYYYFMLVQLYGGVPLRLTPVESVSDVQTSKSSISEVYAQVLKDMEEAEPLVKDITQLGYGGRVNKSAVRGLLARVNLTMAGHPLMDASRYAEVKKWCKKIIDDPIAGHALNPDRNQVFINYATDKYDIKESIWEVEFWGNNLIEPYKSEGGQIGSAIGPTSNNEATGVAYGYSGLTRKMSDVFDGYNGDMRKYWNIAFFEYIGGGVGYRTNVLYGQLPNGTKDYYTFPLNGYAINRNRPLTVKWAAYRPGKYRREYETYAPKGARNATPENFPLLRFADVLLMYAEAENELNGPTDEAVNYVNMVRQRGWSNGGIADDGIRLISGGAGYSAARPPVITISGGGGSDAKAVATVNSSGRITAIALLREDSTKFYNRGSGYTSFPTITITDPGGAGTGATAQINKLYYKLDAGVPANAKAGKDAFRAFLQDERVRELCNEALRKFDLVRWGILVETYSTLASQLLLDGQTAASVARLSYVNATARDTLWPIPALEISANPTITQNPGWF